MRGATELILATYYVGLFIGLSVGFTLGINWADRRATKGQP